MHIRKRTLFSVFFIIISWIPTSLTQRDLWFYETWIESVAHALTHTLTFTHTHTYTRARVYLVFFNILVNWREAEHSVFYIVKLVSFNPFFWKKLNIYIQTKWICSIPMWEPAVGLYWIGGVCVFVLISTHLANIAIIKSDNPHNNHQHPLNPKIASLIISLLLNSDDWPLLRFLHPLNSTSAKVKRILFALICVILSYWEINANFENGCHNWNFWILSCYLFLSVKTTLICKNGIILKKLRIICCLQTVCYS